MATYGTEARGREGSVAGRMVAFLAVLMLTMGVLVVAPASAWAAGDADTGKWVVNADGTLSVDEAAAQNAVRSVESNASQVLIGAKGGTITLPSSLAGNPIVKYSNSKDAVTMLYNPGVDKSAVATMLKNVTFSSDTTSVNIAVMDGSTSITVSSDDKTFGVVNIDGTTHMYKYVTGSQTWIGAYADSVTGGYTLGGFKGYLATVTSQAEAELLKGFYDSVSSDSTQGGWIGATSMRYVNNTGMSDYNSVNANSKVTPNNYENVSSITKEEITNGWRIKGSKGAYYWTNKKTPAEYAPYFYWASGPETGQQVPTTLWRQNTDGTYGEPNNSSGECATVASYSGTWRFNDFAPTQTVPGYFLEFSVYDGGLAGNTTYKSTTIYKVTYDKNGATSGTVPDVQAKFEDQAMTLATNAGNLAKDASVGFNGWNTRTDGKGTHYDAGGTYPAATNSNVTLYAEWVPNPAKDPAVTGADDITLDYGYGEADSRSVSVSATADAGTAYTLSYQWYSNTTQSNQDGTLIAGATSPTYEVPGGYDLGDYYYYCIVTAKRNDNNNKAAVASRCAKVTVQRAPATISFAAPTVSKTYGDAAFTNAVTNSGDGAVTYKSSNESVAKVNASTGEVTIVGAGSATITATVADGTHYTYAEKEKTFSLTVEKAAITPTVTMSGYVYGDALPTPATSGNTGNGTVTYYYGTTDSASGGSAWSEVTPTKLDVGTYYMYAEVAETDNYHAATSATTSFAVSPATMQVSATGYTGAYDGGGHGIAVDAPDGAAVAYRTEDSGDYGLTENPSFAYVGTYTVYYQVTKANYTTVEGSQTVTISQAQANAVTVSLEGWTYGKAAKAPTSTAAFGASTVEYSYSDAEDGTFSDTVPTDAGTWYVRATVPGTDNYVGGQATASFKIARAAAVPATVAPNDRAYDGSDQALATADASTLVGGEMSYALGADATTAPAEGWGGDIPTGTDAGTYHVWHKVVGDANHNDTTPACVTTTIGQAKTNNVTVALDDWTYGDAPKTPSVTADFGDTTVVYTYSSAVDGNFASEVPTEAGTRYVKATIPATNNYVGGEAVNSFAISKAPSVVTKAPMGLTGTYNGKEQTLATAGAAMGGEMRYALGTDGETAPTDGWSGIPSATNAGTYFVWYKVVGDKNHNDSVPTCTEATIGQAQTNNVTVSLDGWTYGDAPKTPSVTADFGDTTVVYTYSSAVDGNFASEVPTEAGTRYVKATIPATNNYVGGEAVNSFAISKAPSVVTKAPTGLTGTYNGMEQELVTDGVAVGGEMTYALGTDGETAPTDGWSETIPTEVNVGTYYVWSRVAGDDNHNDTTPLCTTATIGQAKTNDMTVALDGWTYGDAANEPTTIADFGADTATYTYSDAADGVFTSSIPTEAGVWYVRATIAETANYVGAVATSDFTIDKADSTPASINAAETTYNGMEQMLAAVDDETLVGGEMRYALGMDGDIAPTDGWNESVPMGTNAGTYFVWSKVVGDKNHSDSAPSCTTATIARRRVTLTSATAAKPYDGHPLTADEVVVGADGFADGEGASFEVTGSQTIVGTSANTFTFALGEGTLEGNYDVQTVEGQLTVTNRDAPFQISPTAKSATFAYDGSEHQVSGFVEESFEVGGLAYTVSGLTAEASATYAGTYAVNVVGTAVVSDGEGNDVSSQFAVTPQAGSLVIEQAPANDVSVSIAGWTHGEKPSDPTSTAAFGADTVTYSYAASAAGPFTSAVPTDAGTWYVKAGVPETANYVAGEATASFSIAKAPIAPEVSIEGWMSGAAPNAPVLAEGSNPGGGAVTYDYRVDDASEGGEGEWSSTPPKAAGRYLVRATVDETANYLGGSATAAFTVASAPAGTISTQIVVDGDSLRIDSSNLDEIASQLLDDEERSAIEAGENATLTLRFKRLSRLEVPAADASAIMSVANGRGITVDSWMDITLVLRVASLPERRISNANAMVRFAIAMPEELRSTDDNVTRTFYLLRCHDGVAEVIASGTGDRLEAESDGFSTYAIGYSDEVRSAPAPTQPTDPEPQQPAPTTPEAQPAATPESLKVEAANANLPKASSAKVSSANADLPKTDDATISAIALFSVACLGSLLAGHGIASKAAARRR